MGNTFVRYGIVVLVIGAAILLRSAADPWLGDRYPLITLFAGVGITIWAAGVGPALVVALVGYALANYLYIEPRGSVDLASADDVIAFVVYLFTCALLIGFGEGTRRAWRQADAAADYVNRALRGARMVAWEWEPDANRFAVTDNATEFFGLREPIRSAEDGVRHIHPDDLPVHADAVRRALKEGSVYQCAYRFVRPRDGRTMWVEDHGTVTRGADGRTLKMAGVAVDITAQKELEDVLSKRAEELREADHRKNEFLALLAHELRNPLAPMRASLQIMKMVDTEDVTATQRAVLERQVAYISRLIDDLMDVSRIDRGKIALHRELVDLKRLIGHAVEFAYPALELKRQQLTQNLPAGPVYVDADVTRVTQIIGNVLANAAKFTSDGGSISIGLAAEQGQAVIRVRDNGIGIAADQQERIFERFVQLDASLERVCSGLGVGLTLVKTLVELHGGSVAVASAGSGAGSEFTLRLPLADALPMAEHSPASVASAPQVPRRILVVDDNVDAADSLALILRLHGHEVRTADGGEAGLEIGAEFHPEVIILDLGMPGMNGYDTARHVRRERWGKSALLIALTGWGQPEDRQRSAEAGFQHHLVKPADLDELSSLIDRHPVRERPRLVS